MLADFLGKILKWEPKDRPSAQEMLQHPWLKMIPRYDVKISRKESREYRKLKGYEVSPSKSKSSSEDDEESDEESDEEEVKQQAKDSPRGSINKEDDGEEEGWESISAENV